jgi:energy-coupling factor transporter ATP-binding protein EcfA2
VLPGQKGVAIDVQPSMLWFVGPNGSGKTQALKSLSRSLNMRSGGALLLADRISPSYMPNAGVSYDRNNLVMNNARYTQGGGVLPTIARLINRPDLRMRVEATLEQLLGRRTDLRFHEGLLRPMLRTGGGELYYFEHEAQGILELLVLLTYIYDEDITTLLIDEPELNLHPQYQAFVLGEIRAELQRRPQKQFVMATHSPWMLDIRQLADLQGLVIFHADGQSPTQYRAEPSVEKDIEALLPHLSAEHRSFYFAPHPVFVEGARDATLFHALQQGLGLNAEAAGGSLISVNGKDGVARAYALAHALGKRASAVLDLDALFDARLQRVAELNPALNAALAQDGHGTFAELRGQIQRQLDRVANEVQTQQGVDPVLIELAKRLTKPGDDQRRIVAIALRRHKELLERVLPTATNANGKLDAALRYLAQSHIYVLPQGALEHHLPGYEGDAYALSDKAKGQALDAELEWLQIRPTTADIRHRYKELAAIVERLPAHQAVNLVPRLQRELSDFLSEIMRAIYDGVATTMSDLPRVIDERRWTSMLELFTVSSLDIQAPGSFSGEIRVLDRFGLGERVVQFTNATQPANAASLELRRISE